MTADHDHDLEVAAEAIDRLAETLSPDYFDETVTLGDVRDWLTGQARRVRSERGAS